MGNKIRMWKTTCCICFLLPALWRTRWCVLSPCRKSQLNDHQFHSIFVHMNTLITCMGPTGVMSSHAGIVPSDQKGKSNFSNGPLIYLMIFYSSALLGQEMGISVCNSIQIYNNATLSTFLSKLFLITGSRPGVRDDDVNRDVCITLGKTHSHTQIWAILLKIKLSILLTFSHLFFLYSDQCWMQSRFHYGLTPFSCPWVVGSVPF